LLMAGQKTAETLKSAGNQLDLPFRRLVGEDSDELRRAAHLAVQRRRNC